MFQEICVLKNECGHAQPSVTLDGFQIRPPSSHTSTWGSNSPRNLQLSGRASLSFASAICSATPQGKSSNTCNKVKHTTSCFLLSFQLICHFLGVIYVGLLGLQYLFLSRAIASYDELDHLQSLWRTVGVTTTIAILMENLLHHLACTRHSYPAQFVAGIFSNQSPVWGHYTSKLEA